MSYNYARIDDEDAKHFQEGDLDLSRDLTDDLQYDENEEEDRIDQAIGGGEKDVEDVPMDPFIEARSKAINITMLMDLDKDISRRLDTANKTRSRVIPSIPDEIRELAKISRDSRGRIIDSNHKTLPILTKYERTGIISERSLLLEQGYKSFLSDVPQGLTFTEIAEREVAEKAIPIIIIRELPSGKQEYWYLEDLLDLRY